VPNHCNTSTRNALRLSDWLICVQIWKHMGRTLLKTVQTITTFRNPLADPVHMGTRRGPPLVRGPQFENRWLNLPLLLTLPLVSFTVRRMAQQTVAHSRQHSPSSQTTLKLLCCEDSDNTSSPPPNSVHRIEGVVALWVVLLSYLPQFGPPNWTSCCDNTTIPPISPPLAGLGRTRPPNVF